MNTLLTLYIMFILLIVYIYIGESIYRNIDRQWKMSAVAICLVIFLWPLSIPAAFLYQMMRNIYYIIKHADY